MEPFQTAAQRKVLAELGVLALQVLDALLGLRYGFDRVGIAVGDLVGQPLDLALERGDLVAVRLDLRLEQAAGGLGVLGRWAARAEQHRKDLLDCWGAHIDEETLQEGRRDHTAYQWCDLGFVPIAEARWRLTRYGGNSAWYYCSPWDVRYDPDRAKELLETGPREYDRLPDGRPYDGRPWWQA